MAKGRDFSRVTKRAQARRSIRDQVTWGLLQRDKSAAALGARQAPSKAELRRQAQQAWEAFTSR